MPAGKRGPGSTRSRGGAPKGAPASVIGRLISGLAEIGPTARRATGAAFRAQRLSALCPPSFCRGEKEDGVPGADQTLRAAKRWLRLFSPEWLACTSGA